MVDEQRKVGDIIELAEVCQTIMRFPPQHRRGSAADSPRMIWNLLRAGQMEWLIGEDESSFLEVKSVGYDLMQWPGKIELAQDVARFANSEEGGVLIVGFRTKRRLGGETISKLTPIDCQDGVVDQYRKVIDSRVYPLIDGLEVERFQQSNGNAILAVKVPRQNDESKPFLVHGAIVGDKYEGAFISIVRRRADGSVPVTAPAIHAYLAAGRRAFHRASEFDTS
ncbi:RNA-binding domain-containing protein [Nocardia farcinica]|uniref:RNA-binding domain-containing protein n=1 Tax=Nocardia farcinica TaxID=37329 RepID=UPI0010CA13E5|nr:RNA-binding domain-containing protein [Nocardia farcinica]